MQVILASVASAVSAWGVAVLAKAIRDDSLDQALSTEVDRVVAEGGVRLSEADKDAVLNVVSYSALVSPYRALIVAIVWALSGLRKLCSEACYHSMAAKALETALLQWLPLQESPGALHYTTIETHAACHVNDSAYNASPAKQTGCRLL